MQFNYILVAFASHGTPPLARKLKSTGKDYQFAPLAGDGLIYTPDIGLWNSTAGERTNTFCPDRSAISQAMRLAEDDNCYFVMALTHLAEFDPPGTADVHLPLVHRSQINEESDNLQLTEVGFDVVDQWTGLSALTNIGYSADDLLALRNAQFQVNQFGLFDAEEDAVKFADFAAVLATEHAPFIPLKTFVRIPDRSDR